MLAALLLSSTVAARLEQKHLQRRKGSSHHCFGNRPHVLHFDTVGAPDDSIVQFSNATGTVKGVDCDIDETQLQVTMTSADAANQLGASIKAKQAQFGEAYITGGSPGAMTCNRSSTAAPAPQQVDASLLQAMEHMSPAELQGSCEQFKTCDSCAAIPFCNFCPLDNTCTDSTGVFTHACKAPGDCVGPECGQAVCPRTEEASYLMRRIVGYEINETAPTVVIIHAVVVKYDELFSDANISMAKMSDAEEEAAGLDVCGRRKVDATTSPWCFGWNVDLDTTDPAGFCKTTAGPISLFDPNIGPASIDVSCSNCFMGYEWDFVFDMHIKWFKLEQIQFGMKNILGTGALVITATAEVQSQLGFSKTLDLLGTNGFAIKFDILGLIPFQASVNVPVTVGVDASYDAKETVTFGHTVVANYGDNYKSWTHQTGWDHIKSTPQIVHTPVFSSSKTLSTSTDLTLTTVLDFEMDNVYKYSYTISADYHHDMSWTAATNEMCMHSSVKANAVELATLHINVAFIRIGLAKQWGPYTRWTYNHPIKDACHKTNTSTVAALPSPVETVVEA